MINQKNFINKQLYSECQLITIINAHIFYGGDYIKPGYFEYERLVDFTCARHGGAICIDNALKYFSLKVIPLKRISIDIIKTFLDVNIPIALCIYDKQVGNHSVLCVGYYSNSLQIMNYQGTNDEDLIEWDVIKKKLNKGINKKITRHSVILQDIVYLNNRGRTSARIQNESDIDKLHVNY